MIRLKLRRKNPIKKSAVLLLFFLVIASGLTAKLQVMSTSPTNNATNISSSLSAIFVTFNSNMFGPSLKNSIITCAGYPYIPLNYSSGGGTKTIGMSLGGYLSCGNNYTVLVSPLAGTGSSSIYSNFSQTAGLDINGNAYVTNNILRLTPSAWGQTGSTWLSNMQFISNGFNCKFQFRILYPYGGGSEGFAFCIHTNNLATVGLFGQQLGYGGVANLYSVEFDTVNLGGDDPNGNNIAIHCGGRGQPTPANSGARCTTTNIPNMKDGNIHLVIIRYVPGTLQVFIDNTNTPVLTDNVTLNTMINMLSNRRAWIGFTAATGAAWQAHEILSLNYRNGPPGVYLGTNYSFQFSTAHCQALSADIPFSFGPTPAWYPSVTCDPLNRWNVVFQDIRSGPVFYNTSYRQDIFYKRYNGTNWTSDIQVSLQDFFNGYTPEIACSNNNIYVTWADEATRINMFDTDVDVFFSRSSDGGLNWSVPVNVSKMNGSIPATVNSPKMAVSPMNGKICIIWMDPSVMFSWMRDIKAAISSDKGQTWFTNQLTFANTQTTNGNHPVYEYPSVKADNAGNFYGVWDECAVSSMFHNFTWLRYSKYNGVSWSAQKTLASYDSTAVHLGLPSVSIWMPDIAVKDTNHLYVVFTGDLSGYPAHQRHVYFMCSTNGAQSWSAPVMISTAGQESDVPKILYDPFIGGVRVVYEDNKHWGGPLKQRFSDIVMATSGDNGKTWIHQTLATGNYAGDPRIAINKSGGLAIVWEDNRTGDWRVYMKTGP